MGQAHEMKLSDKLYRTKYEPDAHSHITVDDARCRECAARPCLHVCPAEVYTADPADPKGPVRVAHENCLECGTCRRACRHGAIEWRYPDGGMGVKYRFG